MHSSWTQYPHRVRSHPTHCPRSCVVKHTLHVSGTLLLIVSVWVDLFLYATVFLFFDGWHPSAVFFFSPNLELVIGGTRVGWGDGNEGGGEAEEEGCGEGAFNDSIGGVDGEERFGVEISSVEFEDEQFVVTEEEEDIDVVVTTQGGALRTLEGGECMNRCICWNV